MDYDRAGDAFVFTGMIEPVVWGDATYTVLRVPEELAGEAKAAGSRRVAGTVNDTDVNLALNRAPVVVGPFLWAGKSLLRRAGIAEGDLVDVMLEVAASDHVPLAPDVRDALETAGRLDAWEALGAPDRRRKLHRVESTRAASARSRAIAALVSALG